jgi:hypothetical protein
LDTALTASFPDPAELAERIARSHVEPNLTIADLIAALLADGTRLDAYEDVEHLAIKAYEDPGSDAGGLADRMLPIRNEIAHELWSRELLVAIEIIDQLLFTALKHPEGGSPVRQVLEVLRGARVEAAGFVVFAVHSLGLESESLDAQRAGVELIRADWGIALSSQTNNLNHTIALLERVRQAFGVSGVVPRESIRHWRRSRHTEWLERNPLLCVRVAEAAGTYYGNEALLLSRLQAATSLIAMLAALQPKRQSNSRPTMSTWVINNQQTLNIHHYLVLSPGRSAADEFDGDCVPISRGRPDIVAMSELHVDIDPVYWEAHAKEGDQVQQMVWAVYRGYLRYGFDPDSTDEIARIARRRFESLTYFQRSFSGQGWRDIISLSIAFELLLHERSAANTAKRIRNTIKSLFGASAAGEQYASAFSQVYDARNKVVHDGIRNPHLDLDASRRAYVSAFVKHVEAVPVE